MARSSIQHPSVDKVGLLGDDEGNVTILLYEAGECDPVGYDLSVNQQRWLYDLLRAFCE